MKTNLLSRLTFRHLPTSVRMLPEKSETCCGAAFPKLPKFRKKSATTSKISDEQLFYCKSRGISEEDAVSLIVNGFCKEVMQQLPMEFAIEAAKLINISLEGSVG